MLVESFRAPPFFGVGIAKYDAHFAFFENKTLSIQNSAAK
jgi:hypothetical protein